jgi:hypothetical protein
MIDGSWTDTSPAPVMTQIYLDGSLLQGITVSDLSFREHCADLPVDSSGEHIVRLVGLVVDVDGNYQSRSVERGYSVVCPPKGNAFLRGACSADGSGIGVTSAVFALERLFRDGPEPRCTKACDSNGDGSFDISDPVHILLVAFQGLPAPQGCETAPTEECAQAACPGGG